MFLSPLLLLIRDTKYPARRALHVLRKMESLYLERLTDVQPDIDCYKHVLRVISQSNPRHNPDMGEEADNLLSVIEERALLLDSDCFSSVIRTWSNHAAFAALSSNPSLLSSTERKINREKAIFAAKRADDTLKRMQDMFYRSGTVHIKTKTEDFNEVIRAWSNCKVNGAAKRASELLSIMEDADDDDIKPTEASYLSAIRAWANSPDPEQKVNEAETILNRMLVGFLHFLRELYIYLYTFQYVCIEIHEM